MILFDEHLAEVNVTYIVIILNLKTALRNVKLCNVVNLLSKK